MIRIVRARRTTLTDIARATTFVVALAFSAVAAAAAMAQPAAMDFIAHYAAASLVLSGQGASVLDPTAVLAAERAAAPEREALLPYVRPPAFALLMAPLALLPFKTAFALTVALDAVILVASVALLLPRATGARSIGALLLVAPPAALAVAHAQMSPLALLLVVLATRLGPRGGGIALGLSLLRPQTAPLLLLAGLLDPLRRSWTVAGAGMVIGASALVVGPDGLVRYAGQLSASSEYLLTGEFGYRGSVGWTGLALWLGIGPLGIVASLASLAAGAVVTLRTAYPARPAVAALWSVLANPAVLVHDAVLAYPALLAVASRQRPWDVASVLAWLVHVLIAPLAVVWSLALAFATLRRPGHASSGPPE